jgi:DNA adenine methylase
VSDLRVDKDHLMSRPKPFVKWAGGKKQLVERIATLLPERSSHYYEPFVGGGAVFWYLAHQQRFNRATLNDWNAELVDAYRVIRDYPSCLIEELQDRPVSKDEFMRVRSQDPAKLSPIERAARLIYLNKTCFNGLYRVNQKGQFNVPYGKWKTPPKVCDADNLRVCSQALADVDIVQGDFAAVLQRVAPGQTVYLDPPYVPLNPTSNFASYTSSGFTLRDQQRLAREFRKLVVRGAHVVLSNSDTPKVRELYQGCELHEVQARRSINSKGTRRGPVGELLVVGGPRSSCARRTGT